MIVEINKQKRFLASFLIGEKQKNVYFGQTNPSFGTFIDHGDVKLRENYKKRHLYDNINDPLSPGALSYHILWGDSKNIDTNIKQFKKRFNV